MRARIFVLEASQVRLLGIIGVEKLDLVERPHGKWSKREEGHKGMGLLADHVWNVVYWVHKSRFFCRSLHVSANP